MKRIDWMNKFSGDVISPVEKSRTLQTDANTAKVIAIALHKSLEVKGIPNVQHTTIADIETAVSEGICALNSTQGIRNTSLQSRFNRLIRT